MAHVPEVMRGLDTLCASLAEGISNTILEAMATGLPIVATTWAATANADDSVTRPPGSGR